MRLLMLALVALCVAACAVPTGDALLPAAPECLARCEVYLAFEYRGITYDEKSDLQWAVMQWTKATKGRVCEDASKGRRVTVQIVEEAVLDREDALSSGTGEVLAEANMHDLRWSRARMPEGVRPYVFLHEVGHILGLGHGGYVMQPVHYLEDMPGEELGPGDVAMYCARYGCACQ